MTGVSRLILPSTCTFETWQNTGVCSLKWTGLQDLLNVNVTLRGKMRRCSPNTEDVPEMYLECEGSDCASFFRPTLCNYDDECAANLVCKDLTMQNLTYKDYNPIGLLIWGVNGTAGAACPNSAIDTIPVTETCSTSLNSYYDLLRDSISTFIGIPSTVSYGVGICTVDYDAISNQASDWAQNMVITDGPDYSLMGTTVWNNAFDVPDPIQTTTSGASSGSGSGSGSNISTASPTATTMSNIAALMLVVVCMWLI